MSKKRESVAEVESAQSDVPQCPYCTMNMRCVGVRYGVRYYLCKQPECGKGDAKRGKPKAPPFDNAGFSARP